MLKERLLFPFKGLCASIECHWPE